MQMRMKIKKSAIIHLLAALLFGLLVIACAPVDPVADDYPEATEQMLSAVGFTMHLADTPEKQQHLLSQPQHRMVFHQVNGKMYYTFADAAYTGALYVGDEQAYQRYENMLVQRNLAIIRAQASPIPGEGWGPVWGPLWY